MALLLFPPSLFFPEPAVQSVNKTLVVGDHSLLCRGRRKRRAGRTPLSSTPSTMALLKNPKSWVEFDQKLPPAQITLMESLLTTVDAQLGPQLNPCSTPSDVTYFKNQDGTCHGSVNIRSGKENSKVRYILASWLHCELPFGLLDSTTLICMLNTSTCAPHFLLEIIQNSPTSAVILMDLLPRRDLVLHPDYIKQFYEDTQLDLQRQKVEKLGVVQPYISPFISVRALFSPSAILSKINCECQQVDGKTCSVEELIDQTLGKVAKEIMSIWLEHLGNSQETRMDENEKEDILLRDNMIWNIGVDKDMRLNLPRLFNSDITNRVLAALEKEVCVMRSNNASH